VNDVAKLFKAAQHLAAARQGVRPITNYYAFLRLTDGLKIKGKK
jgi:hypothetical protein